MMMIDVLNFGSFHFLAVVFCAYIVITPQSFDELSLALTFSYYWLQFLIGVIWEFISNSGHFYIWLWAFVMMGAFIHYCGNFVLL
jgi:hypothetical protein